MSRGRKNELNDFYEKARENYISEFNEKDTKSKNKVILKSQKVLDDIRRLIGESDLLPGGDSCWFSVRDRNFVKKTEDFNECSNFLSSLQKGQKERYASERFSQSSASQQTLSTVPSALRAEIPSEPSKQICSVSVNRKIQVLAEIQEIRKKKLDPKDIISQKKEKPGDELLAEAKALFRYFRRKEGKAFVKNNKEKINLAKNSQSIKMERFGSIGKEKEIRAKRMDIFCEDQFEQRISACGFTQVESSATSSDEGDNCKKRKKVKKFDGGGPIKTPRRTVRVTFYFLGF